MLEISVSDLDKDGFLLNTPDGTYYLPDGLAGKRDHSPEDYITKITAAAPGDKGEKLWLDSLDTIFCKDQELIDYVQQIVGMAAVGRVYMESLVIAYGEGRNGKSTFWNTIARVLGTYSGNMLSEVKESIINAYVLKTGLSRPKLSHLMDAETWMDANKAVELGFADEIMARAKAEPEKEPEEGEGDTDGEEKKLPPPASSMLYSRRAVTNALLNKMAAKYGGEKPKADIQAQAKIPAADTETGRSVDALMERLNLLKR